MVALTAKRRKQLGEQLIEASFAGLQRDVGRLLDERADIEAIDRSGYTALSEAAMAGQTVVVGMLLRALANPDQQSQDGRTPLHRATVHGWLPCIKLLLEHGADPFVKDADGATPADLTKVVKIKDTITTFPSEKTTEAVKERRRKLDEMPPVEIVDEPEPEEPEPEAKAEPAPHVSPVEVARAKAEAAAKDKAEREARFSAKMDELMRECGEAEGEYGNHFQKPEPPTARCKVVGCSEARLNGTYYAKFVSKDSVEFEKVGDSACQIYWSERHDEWRTHIGDYKMGSTLFRHKYRPNLKVDECLGVPKTGWQAWFGKGTEPVIVHLPDRKPGEPEEEEEEQQQQQETVTPTPEASEAALAAAPGPEPTTQGEYIELHSDTRLRIVEQGGYPARGAAALPVAAGAPGPEVRLHDGERIVETADGLFGAGEVVEEVQQVSAEDQAAAWLDKVSSQAELVPSWEAVQAAKAHSQQLFAEGKVTEARVATSAAIRAAKHLEMEIREGARSEQSLDEVERLLGVLHSNRSLLVMSQIQDNDKEVLSFGVETAWWLVVQDADKALQADPANFKASFRRAKGRLELGELDDALADATRVVEHYELYSATSNPEAGILREKILEAVKKERRKWGERGQARWNRASAEVLVSDVTDAPPSAGAERRTQAATPAWETDIRAMQAAQQQAAARRMAAAPAKMPSAPRIGGEVEKALLSTLKGDAARQITYIREHVSPTTVSRFWKRAPLGPDLLGVLVQRLADLAEEDTALAAELLTAVGAAPSSQTQAEMFDAEERSALQRLLAKVGPETAAKAWPTASCDADA
mmetsp:Transcript_42638/g.110201  ORF Transcript_42638/g.110201 Transcript_42638/m.110201 type:complete len:815 (-) Transcript_42638:102-2546(-)|eukprot:CAMPEP_0195083568 /NCGR_PEP_ID=MMETSP0448-20130528/24477_1 /TAXON_ID=66468 /ORGANISM="Heterocapsa triquestra, Strain CCMP 448" /LENGTH=814 /DNA_ID=CAMNT_0040116795 /DNA_START=26 /DNA_END=2470 /DNA_ORIENTATION=-